MTITTLLSGDLFGLFYFAQTSTLLCHYILVYTFVAYIAISIHMNVVRRFGGVAAVLLATGRKGMTLVLSFVLFPKAFSWYYVMGAVLVLGGLLLSSLIKINEKKRKNTHRKSTDMSMTTAMNPNHGYRDVEHHGGSTSDNNVTNSGSTNDDVGVNSLEMMDRHSSTPQRRRSDKDAVFFGISSGHDHQQ
jgi:adenosine 3'-phospho 5'-phosphosulfate transporter B3